MNPKNSVKPSKTFMESYPFDIRIDFEKETTPKLKRNSVKTQ